MATREDFLDDASALVTAGPMAVTVIDLNPGSGYSPQPAPPPPFPANAIKPVTLRATFTANFSYRSDAEYEAIKAGLLEVEGRLAELGGKGVRAEFQS